MKRIIPAMLLAVALTFSGCASMNSGTLTHKVTASQHGFLSVITGFQDAEISEHDKGAAFISDDTHIRIQTIIQKAALGGKDLDVAVAAGANSTTIKTKIDAIYALLTSLETDGLTGVKNASSKAILEIALNQIKSVLDLALTQIAQEATPWQPQVSL